MATPVAARQNPEPDSGLPAAWAVPDALRPFFEAGDTEILQELADIFRSDTAARLQSLGQAVAAADLAAVRAQAHAIKGSAVQVGANSIAAVSKRIELLAPGCPSEDLAGLLRLLERRFEEACRAMSVEGGPWFGPTLE